jgi:hypothetical protein
MMAFKEFCYSISNFKAKIVSSNPVHDKVYSINHHDITEILLKVMLSTTTPHFFSKSESLED